MMKPEKLFLLFTALLCFFMENALALDVGDKVPHCVLKKLNQSEQTIDLQQFSDQVIYLDFWASWCGPCAQSFPYMNGLQRDLKKQGLKVIAVNLDEKIKDAEQFLQKLPGHFMVVVDAEQQCAKDFSVQAMPSTYLIDRKGIVQYVHLGFRPSEVGELQAMVEKLLAEN